MFDKAPIVICHIQYMGCMNWVNATLVFLWQADKGYISMFAYIMLFAMAYFLLFYFIIEHHLWSMCQTVRLEKAWERILQYRRAWMGGFSIRYSIKI